MSLFEKDDYEEVDAAITNTKGEICLSIALFAILSCVLSIQSVLLPGEDDADDKSAGSAGTEYDDIEEQAHAVSHPQTDTEDDPGLPLLPKRPENLLGTALKFTPPHCVFVCLVWAHVRTYCITFCWCCQQMRSPMKWR